MLSTQKYLQSIMEGFRFNLGFSGRFYLHGNVEEDAGDKKLIGTQVYGMIVSGARGLWDDYVWCKNSVPLTVVPNLCRVVEK